MRPHDDRPEKAEPSVCWYAPLQLLRTGRQVAIATIFGRNADARIIEALESGPPQAPVEGAGQGVGGHPLVHDYAGEAAPFWIDYVADTGDGWDATATVAYHMASDRLALRARGQPGAAETERGNLLVFGGDQVYPAASFEAYERRLILPFGTAFPALGETDEVKPGDPVTSGRLRARPDVFAIPDNHDWYDTLVSFTRLFCSKAGFAGWRAPQRRSYFALKLPRNWWLIGTDLQLGSDIDGPQDAFFAAVADGMAPEDRIILCHAEPHWIHESIYPDAYAYRNVRRLEEWFGARIKVFLAGDYHFYTRHEGPGGVQKVVAGGGGAFLHLTFGPDDRRLWGDPAGAPSGPRAGEAGAFVRRSAFPSRSQSVRLALAGPFLFHWRNPSFGAATAIAYVVAGEALTSPYTRSGSPAELWGEVLRRLFTDPFSLFLVVAVVLGVVLFTDTHRHAYRWGAGTAHALAHLTAAALTAWTAARWTQVWPGEAVLWHLPAAAALTALGGFIVGPLILSLYLTVSLLVFRRHRDEASSALRCPHFKNFLRLRIDPDGGLTLFPVGIRHVARRWHRAHGPVPGSRATLVPVGGSPPFLIEEPIRISPVEEA